MGLKLVTGATSHLGAHLLRALRREGQAVVGFARPVSRLEALRGVQLELRRGDLLDPGSVRAAVDGVDEVFHCAGVHRAWASDPAEILRPLLEGTHTLLVAAHDAGVKRVVLTSSAVTVGPSSDRSRPLDERSVPPGYRSAVLQARVRAEALALATSRELKLDLVVALPTLVLGPFDFKLTPSMRLLRDWVQGDAVALGLNIVHAEDVARGLVLAMERGRAQQRYLLGGDNLDVAGLADLIGELTGCAPVTSAPPKLWRLARARWQVARARVTGAAPDWTPELVADLCGRDFHFELRRAQQELGYVWRPAREVLADSLRWLLFRGALRPSLARRIEPRFPPSEAWRVFD